MQEHVKRKNCSPSKVNRYKGLVYPRCGCDACYAKWRAMKGWVDPINPDEFLTAQGM